MKHYVMPFFALASCLANAPAAAQSTASDVRCLLVSGAFAKAKDPKARSAARVVSAYYMGRVDSRLSTSQLQTALVAEEKGITPANAGSTMNSCSRFMAQRNAAMQALGQRLTRTGGK